MMIDAVFVSITRLKNTVVILHVGKFSRVYCWGGGGFIILSQKKRMFTMKDKDILFCLCEWYLRVCGLEEKSFWELVLEIGQGQKSIESTILLI